MFYNYTKPIDHPMKTKRRCKAVTIIRREVIRCEGARGHFCAHYGKRMWWPNENGLPHGDSRSHFMVGWILLWVLLTAAAIGLALWFR